MGDYFCGFECHDKTVKKQQKAQKNKAFEGFVKIVVVDSPVVNYHAKTWSAALVAMVYLLMGITALTVYFFALTFRAVLISNIHLYLSTVGYQLCIPASILMFNPYDGPSQGTSYDDVSFEHAFTAGFGFLCSFIGSVLGLHYMNVNSFSTVHAWIGIISFCLTLASTIIGVYIYFADTYEPTCTKFHLVLGLAGYITSTACYILGLFTPLFSEWTPLKIIKYFLLGFSIYNTIVIVYWPVEKLVKQYIQERREQLMNETVG